MSASFTWSYAHDMKGNNIKHSLASTSSSQATPPPWIQKQHQQVAGQELLQQLKQTKLSEQASLLQNSTDPLEVELSNMVKPVMESCTKDSIAVSLILFEKSFGIWCVSFRIVSGLHLEK